MTKAAATIIAAVCGILAAAGCHAQGADGGFEVQTDSNGVTFTRADGMASASLHVLPPAMGVSTTKDYAQYVMDRYRGWNLKPVVTLRGFSFRYVDNAPCSALVTYFDGRSYLLFTGCGDVSEETLQPLYEEAGKTLKLKESLKRESRPNIFGNPK
jgi:hypothetical protein